MGPVFPIEPFWLTPFGLGMGLVSDAKGVLEGYW